MESGERASLVAGHNMYTEESAIKENGTETQPVKQENILGQFHEDALRQVGVGSYQWMVCTATGLCFMADGAQIFVTPYLTPSIQAEMCLEDSKSYWLTGITFLGLIVGTLLCPLADHIGRKGLLIFALIVHLIFNIATAFMPTLGIFLTARFGSYVGLGMLLPTACIMFAEFLPINSRYRISLLLLFWTLGGFYSLLLSYFFLPANGEEVLNETRQHHRGWHKVILLGSLPAVSGLALLIYTSESVRYLLHAGKDVNAIIVYQEMYKWNATRCAQYQLTELELPSNPACQKQPPGKSVWSQMKYNIDAFFDCFKELSLWHNLKSLVLLSLVWASLGFSYHGLSVWVPGKLQWLKDSEYNSEIKTSVNKEKYGEEFITNMQNELFVNVSFNYCLFAHITLSHVTFDHCSFNNVEFTNIVTSKTYFIYSVIENSRFVDTNLTPDRFVNCQMMNNSMLSLEEQCRTDIDFNYQMKDLMQENFLKLVCPLASLALNAMFLRKCKRINIGVGAMILCSLVSLMSWVVHSDRTILLFDMIWSLLFLFAFNATNVITVESYPVHLRATGFGLAFFWFRVFGLYGFTVFEGNISNTLLPGVVIVLTLIIGGFSLFRLPDTSNNLM